MVTHGFNCALNLGCDDCLHAHVPEIPETVRLHRQFPCLARHGAQEATLELDIAIDRGAPPPCTVAPAPPGPPWPPGPDLLRFGHLQIYSDLVKVVAMMVGTKEHI